ncbi:MAG: RES family NAD+ phosphorylase [Rhodospirillaceae bacterium]|nr:RES family NAD+ phosphorylase [Rhodospirillaceae bacterium]
MIHDPSLLDGLSEFGAERFEGEVFRATRTNADPVAASISGGRWAPPPDGNTGHSVLYTSLERDGALAEVASFLAQLTPIPGPRPIKVTRLAVATARTMRLVRADLGGLGVDLARFGERDYDRTQKIGAALVFLGFDGLIAPSARWSCDNLMIFGDNHALTEELEAVDEELVEWRAWAQTHGMLADVSYASTEAADTPR